MSLETSIYEGNIWICLASFILQGYEIKIEEIPASYRVGSVICLTERLKSALVAETKAWKVAFGRALNSKASADMEEIFDFIEDLQKRLTRPIKDLDDVRAAMASLTEIRESEIRIDMTISPIEESYALLHKYELIFSDGNAEKVDSLSYNWKNLTAQVIFFTTYIYYVGILQVCSMLIINLKIMCLSSVILLGIFRDIHNICYWNSNAVAEAAYDVVCLFV